MLSSVSFARYDHDHRGHEMLKTKRTFLSLWLSLAVIASALQLNAQYLKNQPLTLGEKGVLTDWVLNAPQAFELSAAEPGIAFRVTTAVNPVYNCGLAQQKIRLPKGNYRLSLTVAVESDAKLFIAVRTDEADQKKRDAGGDIWTTLKAPETILEKQISTGADVTAQIIIGIGFKENVGQRIVLKKIQLKQVAIMKDESPQAVAAGAGHEYDGIMLEKEKRSEKKTIETEVTVDETKVLRTIDVRVLGAQWNWITSQNYVDVETLAIKSGFLTALEGTRIPLNRMAGTESQFFRWKWAIGPLSDRKTHQLVSWEEETVKAFGPVEWVKTCQSVTPGAHFSWTLNMIKDSPDDSADLAEFFCGDGTHPRGETNWARLRQQYGLMETVPVDIWELGNEFDWERNNKRFIRSEDPQIFPVQGYIELCRRHMAAIRSVMPQAKFCAHAASGDWAYRARKWGDWSEWHREVLKALGKELDYISFHPYYLGAPVSVMEKHLGVIRDDIRSITGDNRIKLFISEHAVWPNQDPGMKEWKDSWFKTHALYGCLGTAHFLNRMFQNPEVVAATYHNVNGGPWGMVYWDQASSNFWRTGMADTFQVLNRSLGREVVALEVSGGEDAKPNDHFSITAMNTGGGMNIVLVNREEYSQRQLHFTFRSSYTLTNETVLTAEHKYAYNTANERRIIAKDMAHSDVGFRTYLMPAKSLVVLMLKK